jgi:hypothetical protein
MTLERLALLGVDPVLIGTTLRFIAPDQFPSGGRQPIVTPVREVNIRLVREKRG